MRIIFRGRHSILRRWRGTSVAPRNVNDISNVTRINQESDFSWQVQHLVRFGMVAGARNVAFFNRKCSW